MSDETKRKIALCLSGGGLRATLYHLGGIRALRATTVHGQRAIERVDHIYAVSGGSILAAHMLVHWEAYSGRDDAAFEERAAELVAFAGSNIRDRVLRRWFLQVIPRRVWQAWSRNPASVRTQLLQTEYERLLMGVNIGACYPETRLVPRFHFLAADFRTGELCAFAGINLEVEDHKGACTTTGCGNVKLAAAVAASSAFPPLFPPLVLQPDLLSHPPSVRFREPLLLTDGGVYDNLGIEKLRKTIKRGDSHPQIAIISDAGAPFRVTTRKSYSMVVGRNIRASDILMNRITDFTANAIDAISEVEDTVVPITARVRHSSLSAPIQQLLRLVRTDLDIFGASIAKLLIDHGEAVTLASLRTTTWATVPEDCTTELILDTADPRDRVPMDALADRASEVASPADTSKTAEQALVATKAADLLKAVADKAGRRTFRSLLLDKGDVLTIFACLLVLAIVFGGGACGALSYLNERANHQLQKDLKNELYLARLSQQANQVTALERQLADARRANATGNGIALRNALAAAAPSEGDGSVLPSPPTVIPTLPVPASGPQYAGPVYVQFAGSLKREEIIALNQALRGGGWNVQGASGERTSLATGKSEVRYGGDNAADAQRLADLISATHVSGKPVTINRLQIVGDTNLEVWISR